MGMGDSTGGARQDGWGVVRSPWGVAMRSRALGIWGTISCSGLLLVGCIADGSEAQRLEPGGSNGPSRTGATVLVEAPRSVDQVAGFDVEIELAGADVALVWSPRAGATAYTVWHGTTAFFEPGDSGTAALASGPSTSFAHAVAGDGQHHYYRVVAHADHGDEHSATVGKYAHRLYAGYNKLPQPLDTGTADAASLLEQHAPYGVAAYLWQAPSQSFGWWFPGAGVDPFDYAVGQVPIVQASGVWGQVHEDVGRVPPEGSVQLPLSPGLNLVTVPLDFGDTTASALLAAVPGAWRIGRWNPMVQDRVWFEGGAGDFEIEAGRDVYVEVGQPSVWPPAPGTTAPPPPTNPLEGLAALQPVVSGRQFTEGALWLADEGVLMFSDLQADQLWRYEPGVGASLVRGASGRFTNGMAMDQEGRRIECQHTTQQVVRIETDGSQTVLADAWQGVTLNSPNDVVVGPDGSLYFADARIGAFANLGGVDDMPLGFQGLYRIDPAGGVQLLATGFADPTGIELSPDGTTLYVSDWTTGWVRAFPVLDDGSVGPGTVINSQMGMADGMCSDVDGNLYVTTVQGLWVLHPDGSPWGLLPVPEEPSNCTFGGEGLGTLYVTARTSVYATEAVIPGAASFGG